MKKYILILIFAVSTLVACNNDYLEKLPVETLTEATAFGTYSNFQTYAWSLYGVFDNANILRRLANYGDAGLNVGDVYAGYLDFKGTSQYNPYAFQTIASASSGNGWNFTYVRSVNIMLANIDKANLTAAEKAHWRSVGYFFRSYYYAELIARFGDVPWVNKVLSDTDEEIYGPRTPRKEVADSVLANLQYAELNIKAAGDGKNTINQNCVRALISRFTLFEGTWRKYHGLGDHAKYLNECVRASELLMTAYPTVNSDYGTMFTSPDLGVVPGVILYKEYVANVIMSQHSHYERTSSGISEMPQHIVDLYLCQDGKTIANSSLYAGDKTPYTTFRKRDHRMLLTIAPPYQLSKNSTTATWDYPEDPANREYLDIMGVTKVIANPGEAGKHKVFPLMNWSAAVLLAMPNLTTKSSQQYLACRGGYYFYKNYNVWDLNSNAGLTNTADKPLFKIEEVLLNEAEAKFELDQFSQVIADKTINKLRPRAKVANMVVADIGASFDPKRDPTVNPVLWEIRRERIVELLGEGFGFYDIRRWKVAPWFVNKQPFGMWATKTQVGTGSLLNQNTGLSDPTMTVGYIYLFNDPVKDGKGWLDKYYLYQVPTNAIALNPKITQNPGW
jgi:hypothetical protein